MVNKQRILILTAGVFALAFSVACGSDSSPDDRSSVPSGNAQGVATITSQTSNTPELRTALSPTVTPSSSSSGGSTVAVPFPFENAVQARASLLGNARFGPAMDALDRSDPLDLKAYPGWQTYYPTMRLVGSAINATPMNVSVYRNILNPKDSTSAKNPKVIAFAVADNKGVCAAGVIRGFPTYSEYEPVDIGSAPCNAQSAVDVLLR